MASWAPQEDFDGGEFAPRQVTPDTKPARRIRASQAEWSDIHQHFQYACCVNCGLAYQSLHHILPRSQGGDDLVINLVPLCGDGTRGCHGLLESHAPGWERVAASVRQFVITDTRRRHYQEDHAPGFNTRYPPLASSPELLDAFRTIHGVESQAVEGVE
jgi:hypothetical protein